MDLHDLITGIQDSFDRLAAENRQLKERVSQMKDSQEYLNQKKEIQQLQTQIKEFREELQMLLEKYGSLETNKSKLTETKASVLEEYSKENFSSKLKSETDLPDKTRYSQSGGETQEPISERVEDMDLLEEIVRDIEGY